VGWFGEKCNIKETVCATVQLLFKMEMSKNIDPTKLTSITIF